MEKIVVVVEEVEVARTALKWALHNILRCGDVVTLLHVYPTQRSRNKKKLRRLRLKGFQLALSFRDICEAFPNTKTEIVVTEGDEEGRRIAAVVREVGASTLVVGLHDRSFLYRYIALQNNSIRHLNCKVLAIKEPAASLTSTTISIQGCSTMNDFSQIEMSVLSVPEVPAPKIPYQICPDPNAIIWRSRPSRK
ncbi:Adenine nucleotide alpha hydrolases-like superfamily protein [Perilla frutescens var. hirtella]|nr:Adenine nucleotide alpha hydrolases-like superfamily protein [Perilla frutescens var. hirtella]